MRRPLFGALAAILFATTADAADASATSGDRVGSRPPTLTAPAKPNPFRISLGEGRDKMPDMHRFEDIASPFSGQHKFENRQYATLLYAKFGGTWEFAYAKGVDPLRIIAAPLPPLRDDEGHLLWFDGSDASVYLGNIVALLFTAHRFDELDRLFSEWNKPEMRTADGQWFVSQFTLAAANWDLTRQYIDTWRRRSPRSPAAALMDAKYWIDYAWNARGGGAAGTVTSAGWKLFEERLQKALDILNESAPFAKNSPLWLELTLQAAMPISSQQSLEKLYFMSPYSQAALTPAAVTVLTHALPRWGGDARMLDDFIREAQKRSSRAEGNGMYARLYSAVSDREADPNIFKSTSADWEKMRAGYEDLVRLYPHSGTILNRFATFACMAKDRETYQRLKAKLGAAIDPSSWESGYSPSVCDERLAGLAAK